MYLEHFQLHSSPFSETVNPENFFPDAGRAEICKGLLRDIRAGKGFAFLLGSEGSGKTLLCTYLVRRLGGSVEVIYIENPMGSFDDLLRLVCVDLGVEPGLDKDDMVGELKKQLEQRAEKGQRVVLIIDDAEKIFLAALERLLRLLCELQGTGSFTLILAGRPALSANLEQLTVYCTGVDLAHGYELRPLDKEETRRYLLHRLLFAGLKKEQQDEVFAEQAVEKIFQAAHGNPRMTNILAEEALRKSSSEKSFMVLLEHVGGKADGPDGAAGRDRQVLPDSGRKKILFAAMALVLVVAAGFFVLRGGGGDQSEPADTPPVTQVPLEGGKPGSAGALHEDKAGSRTDQDTGVSGGLETAGRGTTTPPVDQGVVHVQPAATTINENRKPINDRQASPDGSSLFDERIRASAAWLSGAYTGKYTIQLMMLTSRSARKNVEKLLAQKEYASVLDTLYILQKKTTPPTLFLFYGTYPSMDAARQARNTMPIFLRKHHPYALSIADALTKTED
jgi:type II secretory pathway predicted ATPase ExeA